MDPSIKDRVVALQKSIETGDIEPTRYINPDRYIQHNVGIGDGLAAILALHNLLPRETTRATPIRAFQDGPFGFVHMNYDLWGPKVGFDIHRFEGEQSVEHWDNLQETPASLSPGGHSMVDGGAELADIEKT